MSTAERATGPVIRLLIVDDHPVMRRGLSTLFASASDIDVVGLASDAHEAAALVHSASPDVVLMDIAMPDVDGVEATRSLLASHPDVAVLILTTFSERDRILAGMKAGASGYLLKDLEPHELLHGVRRAAAGGRAIAPSAAPPLTPASRTDLDGLSRREREVLELVSASLGNRDIAHRLGISEGTVKAHLKRIFAVLGVSSRTEAAVWARERGLLRPP